MWRKNNRCSVSLGLIQTHLSCASPAPPLAWEAPTGAEAGACWGTTCRPVKAAGKLNKQRRLLATRWCFDRQAVVCAHGNVRFRRHKGHLSGRHFYSKSLWEKQSCLNWMKTRHTGSSSGSGFKYLPSLSAKRSVLCSDSCWRLSEVYPL